MGNCHNVPICPSIYKHHFSISVLKLVHLLSPILIKRDLTENRVRNSGNNPESALPLTNQKSARCDKISGFADWKDGGRVGTLHEEKMRFRLSDSQVG